MSKKRREFDDDERACILKTIDVLTSHGGAPKKLCAGLAALLEEKDKWQPLYTNAMEDGCVAYILANHKVGERIDRKALGVYVGAPCKKAVSQLLSISKVVGAHVAKGGSNGEFIRCAAQAECAICMLVVAHNDMVVLMPCKHANVCSQCIDTSCKKECPTCRSPFVSATTFGAMFT